MQAAAESAGTIVPTLRYRDVGAAIEWLCRVFGFHKHQVITGEGDAVRYAELTFGTGMIMVGPVDDMTVDDGPADTPTGQPADNRTSETQICYLFVADVAAHCARTREAGAEIVLDVDDATAGGRGYSCRDLEGHVWTFGTYDPRQRSDTAPPPVHARGRRSPLKLVRLAASIVVATVLLTVVVGWALGVREPHAVLHTLAATVAPIDAEALREEREAPDGPIRDLKEQLAQERNGREAAERAAQEMRAALARERRASAELAPAAAQSRETERALKEAREQLARERADLDKAQRAADEARERLSLAERSTEAVRQQLAAERSAREAAVKEAAGHAAKEAREHTAARSPRPGVRLYVRRQSTSGGRPWTFMVP
jgi:uncharacterized glyoxalase superfamily protein PhnB